MDFAYDLPTVWFLLVGVLITGYAILDGFDLGVGALHLLARTDTERRIMLNSIGPVWDGNEVWLITGGGALFAAFPHVYATIFSGFYTAFMLLLAVLIFRAVAIEFRSKQPMPWWRKSWDTMFSLSSILIALLAGVALGNVVYGIPLGADMEYRGSFLSLLRPYPLLMGITTVALFMMHGAIYVHLKTEGEFQLRIRSWINRTIIFFVICYATLTFATFVFVPHLADAVRNRPIYLGLGVLTMFAIANIPREVHHGREWRAFLSSSCAIAGLLFLPALALYPNIVVAQDQPELSLTVYNAVSSTKTLTVMLIIAAIGLPFVLAYHVSIYWIFRGKVKLDSLSY